jgi:hypothetical protein
MSLSFPLSPAAFADLLDVGEVVFNLGWSQEMSLAGGGEQLAADRAPARWMAEITTVPLRHTAGNGVLALINVLAGGINTFYLYPPAGRYPQQDPTGATFGAATPVVGTITDRFNVAFTGFPNGYALKRGDFFQIIFGSTRRYLGQFAEDKTASGAGAVAAVRVTPALPATVATSDAVTVLKPAAKFKLVPNSARPSLVGLNFQQISFSAEQTYAA